LSLACPYSNFWSTFMNTGPNPATAGTITQRQLDAFRAQLDEQRRFRLDQLDELRTIDPHNASEVTEVLATGARIALRDVLAALHRMDTGEYGTCTDCGCTVPLERLEVLPQVGQCLECSREAAIGR
jgi:RNA polymerase-binding transcription factor DksA